jgi:hypothetical protein
MNLSSHKSKWGKVNFLFSQEAEIPEAVFSISFLNLDMLPMAKCFMWWPIAISKEPF